jgi:anti-sigma B factor antagonist
VDASKGFGRPLHAAELFSSETFSTRISERDDVVWLALGGELDVFTAPRLREALEQAMPTGSETLVMDLRGLNFIDSSGLAVILGAHERVSHSGSGSLSLVIAGSPSVESLFETIGAADYLSIVEDAGELTGAASS